MNIWGIRMKSHAFMVGFAALMVISGGAQAQETIRFAVGPYQPTPEDTQKAFEPFFRYVAGKLGMKYEVRATTEQAGVAVALGAAQADAAWMGPWGYVLANNRSGVNVIATVKYDGQPFYHSIVVGKPGLPIKNWPQDAKGMSMSFANASSTSGWLIPHFWYMQRGIDPRTFFNYREGSTHAAQQVAVISGQVQLATDYDRNRRAMIDSGRIPENLSHVYWTSDPLPNDAFAVRKGLDPKLVQRLQDILVSIDEATAKAVMPQHYTGWIKSDHSNYKMIEDAGLAIGAIKKGP